MVMKNWYVLKCIFVSLPGINFVKLVDLDYLLIDNTVKLLPDLRNIVTQ